MYLNNLKKMSDSEYEYDSDEDYHFDTTKENTGTDRFITSNYKYINFIDYPHIYDINANNFYLLSQDNVFHIFRYLNLDNLCVLRRTCKIMKQDINQYCKIIYNKRFCNKNYLKFNVEVSSLKRRLDKYVFNHGQYIKTTSIYKKINWRYLMFSLLRHNS